MKDTRTKTGKPDADKDRAESRDGRTTTAEIKLFVSRRAPWGAVLNAKDTTEEER